jgi:hypothetical protein
LITKEFRSLLTKGVAGKRSKSHAFVIIIGAARAIFETFSVAQRIRLEDMQS